MLKENQIKFFEEFSIDQSKFIREAVDEKILRLQKQKEVRT